MTICEELESVAWPEEFLVVFANHTWERLLKGDGVTITPPADDAAGVGFVTAAIPRKHPQNQRQCGRLISFAELTALKTIEGLLLWSRAGRR